MTFSGGGRQGVENRTHAGQLTSRHRDGGQTLVIVGLCLVVIVGFFGLVIDIGRIYMLQQQLLGKADASALAGAQGLTSAPTAKGYATTCYNAQVPGGSVAAGTPGASPCDGVNIGKAATSYYAIDGNCVEVTTPYSDAFTTSKGYGASRLIRVRAYASYNYLIGSMFGLHSKMVDASGVALQKNSVLAVLALAASNESNSIRVGNNTQSTFSGAIHSNSNKNNSINTNAGSHLTGTAISTVGGTAGTGTYTPTPLTGQAAIADPFVALAVPAVPGTSYGAVTVNSGTTTINPGRYTGQITVNGGTLIMNPGIYYMDNVDIRNVGDTINGSGIFICLAGTNAEFIVKSPVNLSPQIKRMGEWANGRMGEWANGRMSE